MNLYWPDSSPLYHPTTLPHRQIMSTAGPWRSRRIHYGDAHMEEVCGKFMASCPDVEARPLRHRPKARQIVLRMRDPAQHAAKL